MPLFYFNVQDGASVPDQTGTELPDLTAARHEAVRFAGALLSEDPETFWDGDEWRLNVCDDKGLMLFQLTFFSSDAPSVASC